MARLVCWIGLLFMVVSVNARQAMDKRNVNSEAVKAAVPRLFGSSVETAADHGPFSWSGDFNGDGQPDLVAVVRVKGPQPQIAKDVVVLDLWRTIRKQATWPKSSYALAVIHGTREGWDVAAPLGKFLLHDDEFFASPSWESPKFEELIGVVRKAAKKSGSGERPPAGARGDAIRVATEAGIDTYLYWNGKTYQLYEPPEEP